MKYRFAVDRPDYSDLASGRVIRSAPGRTAFPVRLADEVFQRALVDRGAPGAVTVFDPCCGGGYLLTVLGLLHPPRIRRMIAADVDIGAVRVARANLALLTPEGLSARRTQLEKLWSEHAKPAHAAAIESVDRLRLTRPVPAIGVVADAGASAPIRRESVDIVIADTPYGRHDRWQRRGSTSALLEGLGACLAPGAVVALSVTKEERVQHERYRRLERFTVGHRQIVILSL